VAALLLRVSPAQAQVIGSGRSASRRAILHGFRFFGLIFIFILQGVVGPESARRWLRHVRGLEGHGQRRREPGQDHHFALSWRDRLPSTRA